ncbi:hypothetical protein LMJF_31_2570 [Leishmania major strain Friedlin]|uniref:Uncharacterized protein n=1 Tax=Leishmania major TaxID=5664 RepID=Q4Q604_LEIMA|nr:hypothetical protein LMJF_31_2570 [Leishmania major strain Friedlin]CAG9579436.1 hypothetical_protein_-_conserved [Leishmania major strain Friedlin]CAJ08460.1 hypothetical protein LMJF_31_2570 [Leishmania major strain Friedlin]|eukprot:XP_001685244.1 hypothetical protein LMJF_31_2570 [Leishmania major strain Friedlin]
MHYFFLEKQSPLTQRWQVRQVAFDSKYRYLYYTKSLSRADIEEVMTRCHDGDPSSGACHNSSSGTSSRKVKWSGKVKVTQLRYAADEYIVAPGSSDFDERILLTLIVVGYERPLGRHRSRGKVVSSGNRSIGGTSEKSFSLWSSVSRHYSTSRISSVRLGDSDGDADEDAASKTTGVHQPLLLNAENDMPEPESPSGFLHMPSYPVNESLDEDFEDEDENMFRDIDLVPDDEEDEEETSVAASEAETEEGSDDSDADDGDDVAFNSPPSTPTGSTRSGYSFFSRRQQSTKGGGKAKDGTMVQLQFRAANYDVFRIVSLRVRQALVRHGLCGPLHAGLPPYDPRNGIALATVPLHLRHAFRRLNDVVFYSLQIGHVVYVRQQREVRGIAGYLCITHDSILLLQLDGKCPRWLDLEDIVGVQYVLRSNHSFISIRAAEPYPDFVFIPIIPSYPPNSTFNSEECVEGIVSMVRRLLMQRLRAGEEVALAPISSCRLSIQTAEDIEEYDILCHINDLSSTYTDVFKYIAQQQSTGAVPLRWRWDNSKTPSHFTFKRDLYHALEREEGEDSEDEDEAALSRSQRRPSVASAAASHAHMVESLVPSRQQQHLSTGGGLVAVPVSAPASSGAICVHAAARSTLCKAPSCASQQPSRSALPPQDLLYSNASFMPATMTQLMAPPSRGAELRAKRKLLVTRTDRRNAGVAEAARNATGHHQPPLSRPPQPAGVTAGTNLGLAQESSAAPDITLATAPVSSTPPEGAAPSALPPRPSTGSREAAIGAPAASLGPPPQKDAQRASSTPLSTRPASSKPNTYGLVPSQHHTDPATLDFWFSTAAPPVAPVATAQKGVHLSDIHSSVHHGQPAAQHQLATQPTGAASGGHERLGVVPPVNQRGVSAAPAAPAVKLVCGVPGMFGSSLTSTTTPVGAASAPHSFASAPIAGGAFSSALQRAHSPSAGHGGSATNSSCSPKEVTHTTENMSNDRAADEDEESDEDFDSEDMESMLQRPESRAPPAAAGTTTPAAAAAGASGESALGAAGAMAAEMKDGVVMSTDGAAFVPVGGGVVTQVVLRAEMLPGYGGRRDKDHRSDAASSPSPSLQARPEMVAFISPVALPH